VTPPKAAETQDESGIVIPEGVDPISMVPPSIMKMKIPAKVYDSDTGEIITSEAPAKDVIKALDEDIEHYQALLNCVRGG
jgi:hypothetical protein